MHLLVGGHFKFPHSISITRHVLSDYFIVKPFEVFICFKYNKTKNVGKSARSQEGLKGTIVPRPLPTHHHSAPVEESTLSWQLLTIASNAFILSS